MAVYPINKQGIESYKALIAYLNSSINGIEFHVSNLEKNVEGISDGLGEKYDDVREIIDGFKKTVHRTSYDIESVTQYLQGKIIQIEELLVLANNIPMHTSITSHYSNSKEHSRTKRFETRGCHTDINSSESDDLINGHDILEGRKCVKSTGELKQLYGGGKFTPLQKTAQTIQTIFLSGKEADVFDHPFDSNNYRICNQGSAYPTGPRGTCGCCACGTIVNKSGGNTNEYNIVAYAMNNKLCSDNGGTSPSNWVGILEGAGISSHETSGTELKELANYVEKGHGVIIGVSACTYNPQMYGHYFPGVADGHALVLESIIRDHTTGEILEYVVADSNGKSRDEACHRVSAEVLEKAFWRKHKTSVITNDIIW